MLALFCVRLSFGLLLVLQVLWRAPPHPRFVRSQFLIALGLVVAAGAAAWSDAEANLLAAWILAGVGLFLGALSWTLDPPPAGRSLIVTGIAILFVLLASLEPA